MVGGDRVELSARVEAMNVRGRGVDESNYEAQSSFRAQDFYHDPGTLGSTRR